jgi:hypothetical protein
VIHDRLDGQCRASIIHVTPSTVLFTAFWPASASDARRFEVTKEDIARNTVEVSRDYFERKYGKVL